MFRKILFLLFIQCFLAQNISGNIEIKARTAILQDYLSGEILYEKEPDRSIYPASMTKIMTSIIAFDLIKSGDLKLDEKFIISEKAWRLSTAGYSSMFVMVGDEVSVEDLLKGIIVASGNDACIALAEGIAGTEEEFAKFVFVIPISLAFSFIISAKFSSVPAIPSAIATQASLPDAIIIPFNKFSTETSSLIIKNIDEYPLCDNLQAFSEIINLSSSESLLSFNKSKTIIEVIIFVIDAGYMLMSGSNS